MFRGHTGRGDPLPTQSSRAKGQSPVRTMSDRTPSALRCRGCDPPFRGQRTGGGVALRCRSQPYHGSGVGDLWPRGRVGGSKFLPFVVVLDLESVDDGRSDPLPGRTET